MVILHLLAPAGIGGLERVVQSLAIGQQQRGHHVAVAAVLDSENDADAFFRPLERARVPLHRIIAPRRAYRHERRAVRSIVESLNPDVVHSHGYRPDVVDSGLIRALGVATVTTAHGYTGGAFRNRLYETVQRFAFRRFDAVIAVSEPLGTLLNRAGVPHKRLHVVPNGFVQIVEPFDRVRARAALSLPPDRFVIGWVGRMIREKGLDVLVDAMADLGDVDFLTSAIGAGPERQAQEQRAKDLGLTGRIHWAGLVPDAGRYFSAFDVFVISSRTEGLPISLLEAMASDVPIISTRVGGIPRAVTGDEALLVDADQPSRIAEAIRSVYEDRVAAAARAQHARARLVAQFGAERWLAEHDAVYAAAVQRRAAAKAQRVRSRSM